MTHRGNAPVEDPALHAPSIKSGIVAALVARADELGVDTASWFSGLRLAGQHFRDRVVPPYLSYREACHIIERAIAGLPGEGHGLEQGDRQTLAEFGLIGLAMMTATDFGGALRLGVRFAPISGALLDLALDEGDADGVAVVMRMRTREPAIEAYLCEELITSCINLCRGLLGPAFKEQRIDLGYAPPRHAARYSEYFDAPVRFACRDTRVVIARHWLSVPMPAANPDTARQMLALCRAQMPSEQPPASIVHTLERRLALQVSGNPKLTDLAAELHLTDRTLRRQLRAAGTGFRELHDKVRARCAQELLQRPEMPISQVAAAVGFHDVRDFRRAFKRWTGSLPSDFRKQAISP